MLFHMLRFNRENLRVERHSKKWKRTERRQKGGTTGTNGPEHKAAYSDWSPTQPAWPRFEENSSALP
ncbi:MAG: hypothetical protein WA476_02655, partial [Acidobacteriaceae bacterium]